MTVETQLREIDLQGETLGWANGEHSASTIFVVWKTKDEKFVWGIPAPINDALSEWCCVFLHNMKLTLQHLAECTEKLNTLWAASGMPAPTEILGIGIRSEAVRVRAATSLLDLLQQQVSITGTPPTGAGQEMRFTAFFGRDGSVCQLDHDRGAMPTFLADRVDIGSGVEESMGLVLSALTGETITFPWSGSDE